MLIIIYITNYRDKHSYAQQLQQFIASKYLKVFNTS